MSVEGVDIGANHYATTIELLGKVTGVLGLFAAYSFFAGYELVSSYFREFQLPIWLLDLPAYTYPLHSRTPIVVFVCFLIGGLFVGWIFEVVVLRRIRRRQQPFLSSRSLDLFTCVTGVAATFFFTGYTAYVFGIQAARDYVRSNLVRVTLTFKSFPETSRDERLVEANNAGRLRMLTQTKDLVIIYENANISKAQVTTDIIARSELSSVRSSGIEAVQ